MKQYNVAIVGATGIVGQELIKILEERNFPMNSLRLYASDHYFRQKTLRETPGSGRTGDFAAIFPRDRHCLFLIRTGGQPLLCAVGSAKRDAGD